jgi:hypothetical protein
MSSMLNAHNGGAARAAPIVQATGAGAALSAQFMQQVGI